MQTQTSNTLHNAIMEAGSKDRPPMLAPGWIDKEIPISEESPITRSERFQETYKNVLQEIRDQLNVEAEIVQIILIGIDNDIYSAVDACPNASSMVAEDDETSQDKEIDKLMALISLPFKKIYKPTNNNLQTSSNNSRANKDNSPRINRSVGYENQRIGNVAEARETVGSMTVQKSGIQCYNCKEFGHVARECQKQKRAKDAAYHREKMLMCKQEEAGIQLNAEQADWRDDTADDELEDQELEAHYMYMAQLQEVSPDAADFGPIFDDEPLQKELNDDHIMYAHNVIIDSLDMSYDKEDIDQNYNDNDLAKEHELLASLIQKLKCEIDESKNSPESDEVIRLEKESRSKLSDLIRPFDYNKLNNLYDLFVPQREKLSEQRYFSERSRLSHTSVNNGNSKDSFNKQTTVLEKRMDESIPLDKKCQSSIEIFKVKTYVNTIINGVEL
nr:hypothetical protein [Tanacetum cinerariifolium]